MNKFEHYIKKIYPDSVIKHIDNKTIVLTEKGLNFSFVIKSGFYNIDFIYVFDEVKGQGIFNDFVRNLLNSECDVKIVNVVSDIVNKTLENRFLNVISEMDCIEIPPISFKMNKILNINYSDEELEAIKYGEEEALIEEDGFYEDYIINVA